MPVVFLTGVAESVADAEASRVGIRIVVGCGFILGVGEVLIAGWMFVTEDWEGPIILPILIPTRSAAIIPRMKRRIMTPLAIIVSWLVS